MIVASSSPQRMMARVHEPARPARPWRAADQATALRASMDEPHGAFREASASVTTMTVNEITSSPRIREPPEGYEIGNMTPASAQADRMLQRHGCSRWKLRAAIIGAATGGALPGSSPG